MEILSVKEAYFLFKKAWWELARTGCCKEDVRSVDLLQFDNLCPLCEWVSYYNKTCDECPVEWPYYDIIKDNSIYSCSGSGGIFNKWNSQLALRNTKKAKEIAKQISELPLKKQYQKYLK